MEQIEGQVCDSCCSETEDLDYCTDPFLEETLGDTTQFWLCEKCWKDSVDDI